VLVEDDAGLSAAFSLLADLRNGGVVAEIMATGSPKKRYDKAVKQQPQHILRVGADGYYGFAGGELAPKLSEILTSRS
jgi:histidyl-tRNA synthetase